MRPEMILHITRKEILSTLRDRRAIISNLLIPFLILPLVMLGLPVFLGGLFERESQTISEIAVVSLVNLPADLRQQLEAQNLAFSEVTDPFSVVESGDYQAAIAIEAGFAEALESGGKATLTLYSKRGNLRSELIASKVENAVRDYQQTIVAERLKAAGLDVAVLTPIELSAVDASSAAERASGSFGWLIPFFIVIWTLAGGQMTAIDATAGEKERGTLEVLLVSPVRRIEAVMGKFLATMLFGLTAALMAILGYVLGGTVMRRFFGAQLGDEGSEIVTLLGGSLSIDLISILLLIISSLLLAALIAALLIGITMFARSFREAQTYVAPLSFILIIPIVGLQFADFFSFSSLIYLIPILNTMLLMDEIVKGSIPLVPLLLTWGSSLGFAAIFLDFAYRSFKREDVLFRT